MAFNLLLLIALSLAWACDYLFIAAADSALPPLTTGAVVTLIATVVLFGAVAGVMRRPIMPTLRDRPWLVLVMAVTAVIAPRLSVVLAENSITPDLAALTGTTVPVLTFLVTTFVTRTTPYSHTGVLGVVVAVGGLLVFVGPAQLLEQEAELLGILTMMAGGVAFVINGLLSDAKARDLDALALTVWVMSFAAVGLAGTALLVEGVPDKMPDLEVAGSVVASGTIGVALAYLGYYVLLARAGAWFTALYAFLVPPLGVLAGAVVLGEEVTVQHMLGLGVLLIGLWLVVGRRKAVSNDI